MKYLNALNKIPGMGPQRMKILLKNFPDSHSAWKIDLDDFKKYFSGEKLAEKFFLEKKKINPDEEWEKLTKENIRVISLKDPLYPALLKEISNPPYLLYYKGNLDFQNLPTLAIVGSRKFTSYGAQVAQTFGKKLARLGMAIVSGMALGIDSFAHRGALESQGKTIAVLGNSLDEKNLYPKNNVNLAHLILSQEGTLISEYPPETSAGPLTFPARNRIIAGLSQGVLVVEAGEKSGALITARMALDYNREVFSIPGPIFSEQSIGTNSLIKSGAKTVCGINDILEELNLKTEKEKKPLPVPDTQEEKLILKSFSGEPLHIDKIISLTRLQPTIVSGALTVMEMKGWIKNIGGQNYIII